MFSQDINALVTLIFGCSIVMTVSIAAPMGNKRVDLESWTARGR